MRTKPQTAKVNSGIFLTLLYSFTTIALIFISTLFFILLSQRAEAADVDCSKIMDQDEKLICIQSLKPDESEVKKPNGYETEHQQLNKPDHSQDSTFKPRVPPSTPSAD